MTGSPERALSQIFTLAFVPRQATQSRKMQTFLQLPSFRVAEF